MSYFKTQLTTALLIFCNSIFAVSFSDSYMADETTITENPFMSSPFPSTSFDKDGGFYLLGEDDPPPEDPLEPENPTIIGGFFVPILLCIVLYGIVKFRKSKRRKQTLQKSEIPAM